MKIEFWLRTLGNHRMVATVAMWITPRIGEGVELPGEERTRTVHSVTHVPGDNKIVVLLED